MRARTPHAARALEADAGPAVLEAGLDPAAAAHVVDEQVQARGLAPAREAGAHDQAVAADADVQRRRCAPSRAACRRRARPGCGAAGSRAPQRRSASCDAGGTRTANVPPAPAGNVPTRCGTRPFGYAQTAHARRRVGDHAAAHAAARDAQTAQDAAASAPAGLRCSSLALAGLEASWTRTTTGAPSSARPAGTRAIAVRAVGREPSSRARCRRGAPRRARHPRAHRHADPHLACHEVGRDGADRRSARIHAERALDDGLVARAVARHRRAATCVPSPATVIPSPAGVARARRRAAPRENAAPLASLTAERHGLRPAAPAPALRAPSPPAAARRPGAAHAGRDRGDRRRPRPGGSRGRPAPHRGRRRRDQAARSSPGAPASHSVAASACARAAAAVGPDADERSGDAAAAARGGPSAGQVRCAPSRAASRPSGGAERVGRHGRRVAVPAQRGARRRRAVARAVALDDVELVGAVAPRARRRARSPTASAPAEVSSSTSAPEGP